VVTMSLAEDAPTSHAASVQDTRKMEQSVLHAQLDRKMRSAPEMVGERDRSIFWLYYRQGFTAEEIAGLIGAELTAKGVESALRRVAKWMRGEIEKREPVDGG